MVQQQGGVQNMATDFRIRPLADRVVIKPMEREERTKGGIYLPDTASKERPMEGTILAVGEGRIDDNGKRVPMNVKAGDRVLFAKYSGTEYKVDDIEYLILSEKDILGIIQE
jgi:chaperonin GroES